ncbi:MAG: GMP synthase (glutamine-hydrolyzing), partial [Candidatus Levybacteria bacterium CG10_big_fil_rev_8_21_14_0_10_36_30]
MIIIVDFGGQTAHLISRRLRDLGVSTHLIEPENALSEIEKVKPQGLIFSGGPASVYEKNSPTIDKKVFSLNIPMLDICYGLQLRSHLLGGKVKPGTKEYGPVKIKLVKQDSKITKGLPKTLTVWMSHGDSVLSIPKNFTIVGSSENVRYAFVTDEKNKKYGVQFHPEVEHTEFGNQILDNFISICGIKKINHTIDPKTIIQDIKQKVGNAYVIGAVSGGVDSTVAGTLVAKAIGKQFIPVFVNNGLMRDDAELTVTTAFKPLRIKPVVVHVEPEMLRKLKGITDSEKKRKAIGNFYVEVFEREMKRLVLKNQAVKFLLQGTIY